MEKQMRNKTFYEQEIDRLSAQMPLREHHYLLMRQSRAFIQASLAQPIELNEMADVACMSRYHFIRVFQTVYGMTPRQFLRAQRIHKAKALLTSGLSVTQVCLDVGYTSLPTFSKVFKQGTGFSPKTYQQLTYRNPE